MSDEYIMSAAKYAAKKGKSRSWGTRLAQRAIEDGKPYPKRIGNYYAATYEQWEYVLAHSNFELRNRKPKEKGTDK